MRRADDAHSCPFTSTSQSCSSASLVTTNTYWPIGRNLHSTVTNWPLIGVDRYRPHSSSAFALADVIQVLISISFTDTMMVRFCFWSAKDTQDLWKSIHRISSNYAFFKNSESHTRFAFSFFVIGPFKSSYRGISTSMIQNTANHRSQYRKAMIGFRNPTTSCDFVSRSFRTYHLYCFKKSVVFESFHYKDDTNKKIVR